VVAVGLELGVVLLEVQAAAVLEVDLQAMEYLGLQILEAAAERVTLDQLAVLVGQVL
jgi:hypothetical protein